MLLQQLHTSTHARIAMANLPDLTRVPAFANESSTQKSQMLRAIQRWNAGIAQLAKVYGVVLGDLLIHGTDLPTHPDYVRSDGFHPSPSAYPQLPTYSCQPYNG